jgi:hypothetical protein
VEKPQQEYLTLHAIVELASQTVLRVTQEPHRPAPLPDGSITRFHELFVYFLLRRDPHAKRCPASYRTLHGHGAAQ